MKKFILGILFSYLGIPIMQCLSSILSNKTQLINYKIAKQVYDLKKEMNLLQEQQEPIATQAIGFNIEDPQQYIEQEEEDE